MIKETAGKIFLADQRGVFETPKLRRFSTFNFGDYSHPHKTPIGSLTALNEESMVGGHHVVLDVEQPTHVILVPVTGEVLFTCPQGYRSAVEVGQVLVATLPKDTAFQLANPDEDEAITFLHIRLWATGLVTEAVVRTFDFDYGSIQGRLAEIVPSSAGDVGAGPSYPFSLGLGFFKGREEATYLLPGKDPLFFGFVVGGAFEVEGRLLHQNDGLALWNTPKVELEALSENAVILVIQTGNFTGAN